MSKHLVIAEKDYFELQDLANKIYKNKGMKESIGLFWIQVLHDYMKIKGVNPNFSVLLKEPTDYEPID